MNQLCKVCNDPATGYHFGVFTCQGCKSFFSRNYKNFSAFEKCKKNVYCVITNKSRKSCQSCRLKKCFVVGMSKSGSRYGRRSYWFKIHCLFQDQSNSLSEVNELMNNENFSKTKIENQLKKFYLDFIDETKTSAIIGEFSNIEQNKQNFTPFSSLKFLLNSLEMENIDYNQLHNNLNYNLPEQDKPIDLSKKE